MSGIKVNELPEVTEVSQDDYLHVRTSSGYDSKILQANYRRSYKTSVLDYTALLALTPADFEVGDLIEVTKDGLYGVFRVTTGSATTDDGVVVTNSTWNTANKHFKRLFSGHINVKWWGALGDNSTLDTSAFQSAINYANSLWAGGSYLGGGATVFIPAGRYKLGALIYKNGVNLVGEGKEHTQLRVYGSSVTLFAATSNTATQLSASNLYYGSWKDFAIMSWEACNAGTPSGQVGWDAIGFSRWYCENIYFGWGSGLTGIRVTGAIAASGGGPAQWYNTFIGCFVEKFFAGAGGIGAQLGDTDASLEQITSWYFYGGAFRGLNDGSGTALNLQSGTGCSFFGVLFEGSANAIALGSASGTRFANSIDFYGCYWEGNTSNWNVYAGCTNNAFIGGFQTGGTATDNGSYTRMAVPGATKNYIQGSSAIDYWVVDMVNGSTNRPKFTGSTFPSIGLVNSAADETIIGNGNAASSGSQAIRIYKDGNSYDFLRAGASSTTLGATTLKMGTAASVDFGITGGTGSPEGAVSSPVGYIYLRTNGGAVTTLYKKESGTGNTGWVAI